MSPEVKSEVELEIAHILFIDTVGYSKLTINEQRELQDLLNQIVRSTECFRSAEASGKLIRLPTGDGMALVFADDIEAPLKCALEISAQLRAYPQLPVRMGIHSGPVSRVVDVNDRINIAGAGVNVAQRVMSCGDAGHILLSQRVADDLAPYRHWHPFLYDLGECEVKHGHKINIVSFHSDKAGNAGIPRRFQQIMRERASARKNLVTRRVKLAVGAIVIAVAMASGVFLLSHRNSATLSSQLPIPEKSIAVLPFTNRSDEKANEYLADGIQDEILTRLAKIADLKVISRTSTANYKSEPANVHEIARQLGVAHILEGSVQKSGDTVRVNVQLIKATTDSHIWADTFDHALTDVFLVETDVAKAIADQLRLQLTGREERALAANPTTNPDAYDAYMRGLAYTLKPSNYSTNVPNAQKYFREAVRLDPKFALAWALLSYTDSVGYITLGLEPTAALRDEARQASEKALTLQPDLGEARLAVGQYHYACLKDYDTAIQYFEQARRLLPNSSRIPEALAYVARRRGEWDRSEWYFNEAERLDPRNVKVMMEHAFLYDSRRLFAAAQRKCEQILDIVPDDPDTLLEEIDIAIAEGDLPRAGRLLARLHPTAADPEAVKRKIYHAILERRPLDILPWLSEMMAKQDPPSTNLNGELRFWFGWVQQMAQDHASADQSWRRARDEVELLLKTQPENQTLIGDLALINMALGDKKEALTLAERAIAVNPIEKDAMSGPSGIEILARVAAQLGELDRAVAALQKVVAIPYSGPIAVPLTPALLRLDPMFDPLRKDERFQKLSASPVPK
jgi:TolB-like protein/class 3 adenylate cyclase/Tfp pilus assembly protein PilF